MAGHTGLVAFPVDEMDAYVVDAGLIDVVVANDHTAATLTIVSQFVDLTGEQLLELGRFFSSAEMQALLWRIEQRLPAEPVRAPLAVAA